MKDQFLEIMNYEKSLRVMAKTVDESGYSCWIDGYVVRYGHMNNVEYAIVPFYADCLEVIKIDKATICKCAGVIHHNAIFENDIYIDREENELYHVRWDQEYGSFVLDVYGVSGMLMEYGWDECAGDFKKCDTVRFSDFYSMDHLDWLGNSIDNPEYLKGEYTNGNDFIR